MIDLSEKLRRAGVHEYGIIAPGEVEFSEEVRKYCVDNRCRQYGKTWACPPALGTLDECRERALAYDTMLVFSGKFDLRLKNYREDVGAAMRSFKEIAQRVNAELRQELDDYLVLSNEGCGKCESCTYPDEPCRFPDTVHGSIEGYGIWVTKLAKQAGMKYDNGEGTVTFFGAALFNLSDVKPAADG